MTMQQEQVISHDFSKMVDAQGAEADIQRNAQRYGRIILGEEPLPDDEWQYTL